MLHQAIAAAVADVVARNELETPEGRAALKTVLKKLSATLGETLGADTSQLDELVVQMNRGEI